jgi:hypothetical protein
MKSAIKICSLFVLLAINAVQLFSQSACTNTLDISTKSTQSWNVISGPDKTLVYPFKAIAVAKASNWEQDAATSNMFSGSNWLGIYKEKYGIYNTADEPFVFEFIFYTTIMETVSINFKTLYDNAACFFIDETQIPIKHPLAAVNAAIKAKTWCSKDYNKKTVFDGSKTMNFTYNATSTENNITQQLSPGKHSFKVILRSTKNSEIGFVLAGAVSSEKNKIFCKDVPVKKDPIEKDTVVVVKKLDDPIEKGNANNWVKATLANVYFTDGTFSLLKKKELSTYDFNKYTYVDAGYKCSEKIQQDAAISFDIAYPSGKLIKGKAVTDGFLLDEAGIYVLNYYAYCNGKLADKQTVKIKVEAPSINDKCNCLSKPLFGYQYFDSSFKGSEKKMQVSYDTIRGKLQYRHQITYQYDCSSFECKKSGDILVTDIENNVVYAGAFNGLYNFIATKAGTYNFVITGKCNAAVCEPIYLTMLIEEEAIVKSIEPIDEKWKGSFSLQYKTATGNDAWKNLQVNAGATKLAAIAYTHTTGIALKGTYENALKLPMTLSYAIKDRVVYGSVKSYPYGCESSGSLPFNSYESNALKNQANNQVITVFASHKNRIVDSIAINVNTLGFEKTPDFYKLYKIDNAKVNPINLDKHLPENIITGGTSVYSSTVVLNNIGIDVEYIRITVDIDNKQQGYDTSIVGYTYKNYVNGSTTRGLNRKFAILYAKPSNDIVAVYPPSAIAKEKYRFENEDSVKVRDAQIRIEPLTGFVYGLDNKVSIIPREGIKNIEIPFTVVMPGLSTLNNKIKMDKLLIYVLVHYKNCEGNFLSYNTRFNKATGKFEALQLNKQ